MGRHSRRVSVRIGYAAVGVTICTVCAYRWPLRRFGLTSVSPPHSATPSSRQERITALSQSASVKDEEPFDVLVVGGGLIGLYTAVDAAQRGLRVAVLEAADVGAGYTSHAPCVWPGAFPYVQRAVRQRDVQWLRRAAQALRAGAVWRNVAPQCCTFSTASPTPHASVLEASPALSMNGINVATTTSTVSTLIPALHSTEMGELSTVAIVSSLMSLLCGSLQWYGLVGAKTVGRVLSFDKGDAAASTSSGVGEVREVHGGVIGRDTFLDASKAAVALARTAEALGVVIVNYAPLLQLELEEETGERGNTASCSPTASSVKNAADGMAASPIIRAFFRDDQDRFVSGASDPSMPRRMVNRVHALRTRSVVNCAGVWADAVKALTPHNATDTLPSAHGRYLLQSYLVAPRRAVTMGEANTSAPGEDPTAAATETCWWKSWQWFGRRQRRTRTSAFMLSSTKYSFSNFMVLPWLDDCVLLGPSVTPLSHLPSPLGAAHTTTATEPAASATGSASSSSFSAGNRKTTEGEELLSTQEHALLQSLESLGVSVRRDALLSTLNSITAVLRPPSEVPWSAEMLVNGYHLSLSQMQVEAPSSHGNNSSGGSVNAGTVSNGAAGFTPSTATSPPLSGAASATKATSQSTSSSADGSVRDVCTQKLPFLHVYGGTPLHARDIAESVVDKLLHETSAIPHARHASLAACRTRRLRLLNPDAPDPDEGHTGAETPVDHLTRLVRDTYVVRLSDVVFRRRHVGYSSPGQAREALPAVAAVVAKELGWSEGRKGAEIADTLSEIERVAVRKAAKYKEKRGE